MTPERYKELRAYLDALTDREVARLVKLQTDGIISAATVSEHLSNLGEITACVGTAFELLSGEFTRKLVESLDKKEPRAKGLPKGACGPPKHEEGAL